ncbi:MAG: uracil-DNA glycosylase [Thermoguttaceae bacterium]|jgi:uracil-DNA glycosylase family 4
MRRVFYFIPLSKDSDHDMDDLSRRSLNDCLAEYLADLKRAGVEEIWRGERRSSSASPPGAGTDSNRASTPYPPRMTPPPAPSSPPPRAADMTSTFPEKLDAKTVALKTLASDVAKCARCSELVANRTQTVFGTGNPKSELVFIGEGPGAEEDLRGMPFVGRSGKLLTDMIEKGMRIRRSDVFICNIIRCRPPGNRNPSEDEVRACRPFLDATLDVIEPKFICCLGAVAATNLLGVKTSISQLRGKAHDYKGRQVVCTYHPAYLLRNPSAKRDAWEDLKFLMKLMGIELPSK